MQLFFQILAAILAALLIQFFFQAVKRKWFIRRASLGWRTQPSKYRQHPQIQKVL